MKNLVFGLLLLMTTLANPCDAQVRGRRIIREIARSEILQSQFTGFHLYDLSRREDIASFNAEKYFTPASNTKLFTFYAGLKLLGDSIPGLYFIERPDSLIFWGTGDPTFLDPGYKQSTLTALLDSKRNLYWSPGQFSGTFYQPGWTFDDYNEYYQPEISELPVFGNVVRFSGAGDRIVSEPDVSHFAGELVLDTGKSGRFRLQRDFMSNRFLYNGTPEPSYQQVVPMKINETAVSAILKAQLPNYRGMIEMKLPPAYRTLYSQNADSIYRNMLLPSDNFLAEQILLMIAAERGMQMNTEHVIGYVNENLLNDLPDKPIWRDGSGLSQYNLFTPRSISKLCEKIYDLVDNQDRLFKLLPAGGQTGTIRNLFKGRDPFVFAKTGTLSNASSLSGYLLTKKGKILIFSFMNNNYVRPTSDVRLEMERVLTFIHENY